MNRRDVVMGGGHAVLAGGSSICSAASADERVADLVRAGKVRIVAALGARRQPAARRVAAPAAGHDKTMATAATSGAIRNRVIVTRLFNLDAQW